MRTDVVRLAATHTTREAVVADLEAMIELLPGDIDVLEDRHPFGADAEIDEVIGGLDTHLASLKRLADWLAGGGPS
ncbi:hypothetical protein RB608_24850 [Nocardioides sp. LHD-245]|uniref:hypothetical protein n=1 Tax=Nocardioides sp. LHD-245 TaxID=3051387 RepID=UPI0027E21288|nr:hypothetical protein [Nocardioides sp. LHD-245]